MSKEKQRRYVDADSLIGMLYIPYQSTNSYQSDPLTREIENRINSAVNLALSNVMAALQNAINQSARPYSACMLCTRRDCDELPPNLG